MPLLAFLVLVLLIGQIGFWDTFSAILGAVAMVALLVILAMVFLALVAVLVFRRMID